MTGSITIALDVMSGDNGPAPAILGSIKALQSIDDLTVDLVGDQDIINQTLESIDMSLRERITIIHTKEFIKMDEDILSAIRNKKQSSMRLSINRVKNNEAHACVSAGNTGALMSLSKIILKTIDGIDRPAICTSLPTKKKFMQVLDLGANIECNAQNLYQFAVMGSSVVKSLEISDNPRVGLLNIGAEEFKGRDEIKVAADLLNKSNINYVGFVEGNGMFSGDYDVIVTDGFTGNIALKSIEGVAGMIKHFIKSEYNKNLYNKLSAIVSLPVMKGVKKKMDPRVYNGASFLGLNGIVVKSHGSADDFSYSNAIQTAYYESKNNLLANIKAYTARELNE
ncbi:phosphate acyltransferase PlsX [Gammaproteobacteria bacterium]|nr:phosphate acyltransferase PlsX [Gammaproteobacteria bacterium]